MELFHFDIETVGSHKDYTTFLKEDERGANLFMNKFKKMKWDDKYSNIEDAYIDNAGIISTYGKICCISFGYEDGVDKRIMSYYGDNEEDIVNKFNDVLKKIEKKNFNISGFRINHFDIPWVLHKLHKYSIEPSSIINPYNKKPWEMRITDISDDWKQKFAWAYSFDEVCYELGVQSPKDEMSGSGVHKAYWSGNIEDIKKYCEKDVISSIDVVNKLYRK